MGELVINDRRHHAPKILGHNDIPPMTHKLSSAWDQPSVSAIAIDDKYAVMTRETFLELKEYSATNPSGVYEGKMWRRCNGKFDQTFLAKGGKPNWLLCWYGAPTNGRTDCVSNNYREIILSDADITKEK